MNGTLAGMPAGARARSFGFIALALLLCGVLDYELLRLIRAGIPEGKGEQYFLELVLLCGGAMVFLIMLISAPRRARELLPLILLLVVWHTGLQYELTHPLSLVIGAIDLLIPLCLLLALAARWFPADRQVLHDLVRPLGIFYLLCLWGVCAALARGVDASAMIGNARSLILYPLLAVLVPLCIRSWRQLYVTVAVLLVLVLERAVEGLVRPANDATSTLLANGQIVDRISGSFGATNQYAAYVVTGLMLMASLAVAGRSWRLRAVLLPGIVATGVAVLLTLSRGAWLGCVVGLCVLGLGMGPRRWVRVLVLAALAVGIISLFQPHAGDLVTGRIERNDNSLQTRQDYLSLGLQVIAAYPLGAGWGANFLSSPRGATPVGGDPWYHDDYLQLATEIGIPGLAVFLWLWLVIFRAGRRAYHAADDRMQAGLILGLMAAIAAFLTQAATEQFFWHVDIGPHVWMLAGLLLTTASLCRSAQPANATADASSSVPQPHIYSLPTTARLP